MRITNWRQILVAGLLCLGFTSQAYSAGHESGGGGGVVFVNDWPQLVDFYNLNISRERLENLYSATPASRRPEALRLSHAQLLRNDDPSYKAASDILRTWIGSTYQNLSVSPSRLIVNSMGWTFTRAMQFTNSHYRPQRLAADKEIQTAAYFYNSRPKREVKIVMSVWNTMSSVDQIGLVLHEMLRNYQLGFRQNINDEILQKSTALMVYCAPESKNITYLISLLTANSTNKAELLNQYDSVIANCRSN